MAAAGGPSELRIVTQWGPTRYMPSGLWHILEFHKASRAKIPRIWEYGRTELSIAQHYYTEEQEQLLDEYALFKQHMASPNVGNKLGRQYSKVKPYGRNSNGRLLDISSQAGDMLMFPLLSSVEAIVSLHLSNAWPGRGVSRD